MALHEPPAVFREANNPVTRPNGNTPVSGWLRPIEHMVLASARDRRIIGITAPHAAAGVSTVSSAFAEMSARWGAKTLLVDLSQVISDAGDGQRWAPGLSDPRLFLETSERSYDVLQAIPTSATLGAFNSARHFRGSLVKELAEYSAIILDLPSILDFSLETVNPLVASVACDGIIIVCVKGRTTTDHLKQTVEAIKIAGGPIVGTVLNDFGRGRSRRTP